MEEILQWLVKQQEEVQKGMQSFQQSHQLERQALLNWQAERQKRLQDFIQEQASIQQQLLQKLASPMVGDGMRVLGLGLCNMGLADDPDAFLGTLEWADVGAGWDRATWALQLAPYLASEAQVAYLALNEEQVRSYDVVKVAILDRAELSAEKYCQRFWTAKWTGGLQPREFSQELMDWATQWLRRDAQTVGEIMDMLVLEQFLQGLREKIRVWVRWLQPSMVDAAVKLTEEYAEADFPRKEGHSYKEEKTGRKSREPLTGKGPEKKTGDPLKSFHWDQATRLLALQVTRT
ncbi:unnamed protein product [Natator depressus]